ncbi:hypothetical protein L6164_023380 [Bauhinia variegata]|uniref:Uncharacterized protein n=1 Tax=Bauhinia variegata TaxID=167791 RepID=A0ACB9MJF1_BAUVA|nr:hypothetical protein L6164_023380 [Bauhinia variegata]
MESVCGEPPSDGLHTSGSINPVNDEPPLSYQKRGESSFGLTHTGSTGEAQLVFDLVLANQMVKGDVLSVAKVAGIGEAKQTSSLVPLCHNIGLTHEQVDLTLNHEMEAMTAVTISSLTIYDMCKAA